VEKAKVRLGRVAGEEENKVLRNSATISCWGGAAIPKEKEEAKEVRGANIFRS